MYPAGAGFPMKSLMADAGVLEVDMAKAADLDLELELELELDPDLAAEKLIAPMRSRRRFEVGGYCHA